MATQTSATAGEDRHITAKQLGEFLASLLRQETVLVGRILAPNINAFGPDGLLPNEEVRTILAYTPFKEVRQWAALGDLRWDEARDMLNRAKEQEDHRSLYNLACNRSLSAQLHRELAREFPEHEPIVASSTVHDDLLEELSASTNYDTRAYVADNWCSSPDTLRKLSEDPDSHIRQRVARNRRTETTVLEVLRRDLDRTVADTAERFLADRQRVRR